ncbi:MAG: DUF4126 domain-containing protein [Rubrivivax sp.]|nr:DUF4126 domain-containing protein [Rubrivivax sp.]
MEVLALAALASFLCGLRPFAVVFCLGLAGWLDLLALPAGLDLLQQAPALALCGVLALAERLADARSLRGAPEDLLLNSLRVPLGAVVAAALMLDVLGPWGWIGLPLGAALAGSGQALRVALRLLCGLLGSPLAVGSLVVMFDLLVPLALFVAPAWPGSSLLTLALVMLVALPAAIWWARELRSRWRQWLASPARPTA